MADNLRQGNSGGNAPPTPPPPPVQQAPSDPFAGRSDDDFLSVRDARDLATNYITGNLDARYRPVFEQLYKQNLSNVEMSWRQREPEVFGKYGDEIRKEVEEMRQYKVVDALDYEKAIERVKGRHWKDFARENWQQFASSVPTTEGGTPQPGSAGVPQQSPFAEISDNAKNVWRTAGISDHDAINWCRKRGISPEEYARQIKQGQVIQERPGTFKQEFNQDIWDRTEKPKPQPRTPQPQG